jgi:alpha-galactosidase
MAVEGALRGDLRLVYQAIAHDPLTAAMLSLAEIKVTVNELFAQNREYLPHFQYVEVRTIHSSIGSEGARL